MAIVQWPERDRSGFYHMEYHGIWHDMTLPSHKWVSMSVREPWSSISAINPSGFSEKMTHAGTSSIGDELLRRSGFRTHFPPQLGLHVRLFLLVAWPLGLFKGCFVTPQSCWCNMASLNLLLPIIIMILMINNHTQNCNNDSNNM